MKSVFNLLVGLAARGCDMVKCGITIDVGVYNAPVHWCVQYHKLETKS